MFHDSLEAIKELVQQRWLEASEHPLPSEDPFGQVLFFAGMVDQPGKHLTENERAALRTFILDVVGIAEDEEQLCE